MSLPNVRLGSFRHKLGVFLGWPAAKPLVIYLYPGTLTAPGEGKQTPQLDRAQHQGYHAYKDQLSACGYQVVGISAQPAWAPGIEHHARQPEPRTAQRS